MKTLTLFTVLVVVTTASAAYILTLFDNIVHGTLYQFDLRFDYAWANPYWTLLRTVQTLMALGAVFTVINFLYVYRKYIHAKHGMTSIKSEKKVTPSAIIAPEPQSDLQRVGGLIKCAHCQRVFSQPLRMLDFHSDRPRIISICPFCNEVIPPVLRHEEEKGKKAVQKGKKNEQIREFREAPQKEEPKATEETVAPSA